MVTQADKEELNKTVDRAVTYAEKVGVVDQNFLTPLIRLHSGYRQTLLSHCQNGGSSRDLEVIEEGDYESEEESGEEESDGGSDEDFDMHAHKRPRTADDF